MRRPWRPAMMAALVSVAIGCAQTPTRTRPATTGRMSISRRPRIIRTTRSRARSRSRIRSESARADRAAAGRRLHPPGPGREPDGPGGRPQRPGAASTASRRSRRSTTRWSSNTIFPIPSVAPQYSLMGYNPYNLMLAQQFPWFGTLRLRGEAAEQDVKVALAELAAAAARRGRGREAGLLRPLLQRAGRGDPGREPQARGRLPSIATVARPRRAASQQDVLRAEVAGQRPRPRARPEPPGGGHGPRRPRQQLHVSPESDLRTLPELSLDGVPAEVERLYRLAVAARPELRGRLAAIARDEKAVELARKRYYPNVTLGLSYMDMEKTNAVDARGRPAACPTSACSSASTCRSTTRSSPPACCEAQARAVADAKLYDAERDETYREVKDLFTQAQVQHDVLEPVPRRASCPRAAQALELAPSDYQTGNVDYVTLLTAWREVLQVAAPGRPGRGRAGQGPGLARARRRLRAQRTPARSRPVAVRGAPARDRRHRLRPPAPSALHRAPDPHEPE